MSYAPSGHQFEIGYGDQRATIVEVGGGIREYRSRDRDILQPYPRDQMCDGAHGTPLVPWPNRLADGRYTFDGSTHQVALNEPEKHNAIHGLLRWRPWTPLTHQDDRITMASTLLPMQGYPFALEVRIDYRLDQDGLSVTTTATNIGDTPAPYGCGQHPYLSPGKGRINDCTVHLEADSRILTDPERQLPIGVEAVEGTPFDFRDGKKLGDLEVDYAFTDLHRDAQGRAWVALTGSDGHSVRLWVDHSYPIVEIYTGDTLQTDRRRLGLGTEPMTCPPNALQTGEQVTRLEPSASTRSSWGVSLTT